ncbi:MAG TPA: hypothetical protein VFC18_10165 [Burkholderiales bacterium]|nr:hypothetical protein [Burkholderiales bacterium]
MALLLATACGTVEHKIELDQQYSVKPGTKVVLGTVKNQTGQSFDIDVEKMLADAFSQALKERDLEWTGGDVPKLVLTAEIVQYVKGDAFKRWLMPGYGSTVLVVRGAIYESDNRKVGSVDAKRTVDAGGAYTVGAWQTIFKNVADDVIVKLGEQVRGAK